MQRSRIPEVMNCDKAIVHVHTMLRTHFHQPRRITRCRGVHQQTFRPYHHRIEQFAACVGQPQCVGPAIRECHTHLWLVVRAERARDLLPGGGQLARGDVMQRGFYLVHHGIPTNQERIRQVHIHPAPGDRGRLACSADPCIGYRCYDGLGHATIGNKEPITHTVLLEHAVHVPFAVG